MPPKVNLEKFFTDGDWKYVEDMLLDSLKELTYEVDSSTSPTDFKAQTIANRKLYDAMIKFLKQTKVIVHEVKQDNPWS